MLSGTLRVLSNITLCFPGTHPQHYMKYACMYDLIAKQVNTLNLLFFYIQDGLGLKVQYSGINK